MTVEQLNTALYEKVYAEQQEFISSLKTMTPENVIQYAYELVIREDILLSLEENDLDANQCKALLREKFLLESIPLEKAIKLCILQTIITLNGLRKSISLKKKARAFLMEI